VGWGVIFFSPGRSTGRSVIYGDTWRTLAPAPLPLIPGKLSMHSAVRTCGSRVSLVRNIQYISFCVYTSSAPLEATTVYLLLMTGWLVCTDLRTAIHTYLQAPPSSLPPPSWAPCSRNLVKSSILFLYSLFLFLFFIFFLPSFRQAQVWAASCHPKKRGISWAGTSCIASYTFHVTKSMRKILGCCVRHTLGCCCCCCAFPRLGGLFLHTQPVRNRWHSPLFNARVASSVARACLDFEEGVCPGFRWSGNIVTRDGW